MKNTAINTLAYTGIVTLSQYIGSKKVELIKTHNKGGAPLFDFLADCLIGDFTIAIATRPVKIMVLRYDTSNNETTYTSASGFIYLLTKPEKLYTDTGTRRVRYSFIIPADRVEKLGNFENIGIGLYNTAASNPDRDAADFAAFCDLKDLPRQANLINASLVVDWELEFTNPNAS